MKTITIECHDKNDFTVREGDRYVDRLCWEEMLGQVAEMTHPMINAGRFGMLTAEEHAAREQRWKDVAASSVTFADDEVAE